MAIFKNQIEDLAGTIPATCDAEQFLKDGVYDIISKIKKTTPVDLYAFASEGTVDPSSGLDVSSLDVLEVHRDSVSCRLLPVEKRFLASDSNSIHYVTSKDPVYYIEKQVLKVLPAGGTTIRASVVGSSVVTSWDSGTSSITNFPSDRYHQTVLYASLNVLHHRMLHFGTESVYWDVAEDNFSIGATVPTTPTLNLSSVTLPSVGIPVYTSVSSTITTEEDFEKAQMQMQDNLNIFNDANTEYQASLSKAVKDADFIEAQDQKEIAKFQAEIQSYGQQVNAQVQAHAQDLQKSAQEYQWLAGQYAAIKQQYEQSF